MESGESLVFDRAVDFYDRTRSLLPETMHRLTAMLAEELAGKGRCLEIGVGTGRIALALDQAGIEMLGVDLSAPMMARLIENAGGAPPFPLMVADATSLPVADNSMGASLAVHVLHLIPEWRKAASELARSVAPGGVVLVDIGRQTKGIFRDMIKLFCHAAGIPAQHRGLNEVDALDAHMEQAGASRARELPVLTERRRGVYERTIRSLERGTYSITWAADETARRRAGEHLRAWVRDRVGDPETAYDYHLEISCRAYDV